MQFISLGVHLATFSEHFPFAIFLNVQFIISISNNRLLYSIFFPRRLSTVPVFTTLCASNEQEGGSSWKQAEGKTIYLWFSLWYTIGGLTSSLDLISPPQTHIHTQTHMWLCVKLSTSHFPAINNHKISFTRFSRYLCKCVIIDMCVPHTMRINLWMLALMCVYVQGKVTLL